MPSNVGTTTAAEFSPLLVIGMGVDVFASEWRYCDRVSSYVARMVSHDRTDSLLYSNLFSSALNELLETVFRYHGAEGELSCRVLRDGPRDCIELRIPCDADAKAFFVDAARLLGRRDVAEHYRAALFAEGPLDPRMGLLELCVDYAADIRIDTIDSGIVLTAQFNLEGEPVHA